MIALGIIVLLLPLLAIVVVLAGAWREARRSPWSFGVGQVISSAFSAIGAAPVAFFAASFLLHALPSVLLNTASVSTDVLADLSATRDATAYAGWGLLQLLIWPFGQVLLTLLALDALAARPVDVRRSLRGAVRLWPVAIVVTLLSWIGIGIGLLMLVVPGIVLLLNWFVVLPVLAAEDATIFGSFERSTALMRGMRWRLLLLLTVVGVVWMLAMALASGLAAIAAAGGIWAIGAAQMVGATLTGVIAPAGVAAVYHEARTAKEGQGGHDLAAVFA